MLSLSDGLKESAKASKIGELPLGRQNSRASRQTMAALLKTKIIQEEATDSFNPVLAVRL